MTLLEAINKEMKDKNLKKANGINLCHLMIKYDIKPPVILIDSLLEGYKEIKKSKS